MFDYNRLSLAGLGLLMLGSLAIQLHPWGLGLWCAGWALFLGARWQKPLLADGGLGPPARPWLGPLGWGTLACGTVMLWQHSRHLEAVPASFWVWVALGMALAITGAALLVRGRPAGAMTETFSGRQVQTDPWFFAITVAVALVLKVLPWPLALALAMAPLAFSWRMGPEAHSSWRSHGALCAALIILGLSLRLWQLKELPQGINYEEAATLEIMNPLLRSESPPLFNATPKFSGVTVFQHLAGSVYQALDLRGIRPLRRAMVAGWLLLTVYTCLLTATFFSWRAAAGATAYLCLAFFPLHYSRFGFYFIWAPAMAAAALAHSLWALRDPRAAGHWIAASSWAALSSYGWIAGLSTPALVAFVWLAGLGLDRRAWAGRLPVLAGAFACFVGLSVLSIQAHLQFPGGIFQVSTGKSGSLFAPDIPDEVNLSSNLLLHLTEIFRKGTQSGMHFLPGEPYLSLPVTVAVTAGFMGLVVRRINVAGGALLLALFLALLPAWVSNPAGRNPGRLIMLLFPLAVLFGLGWAAFVDGARRIWPRSKAAGGLAGLLVLSLGLAKEPMLYFKDYRDDPSAIRANGGPWYKVVESVRSLRQGRETVFFSSKFTQSLWMTSAFPHARFKHLRSVADIFGLWQRHPSGVLVAGPYVRDWLPWLKEQGAVLESQAVSHPWGDYSRDPEWPGPLDSGDDIAAVLRWERKGEGQLLRREANGDWRGFLWVPRPGEYQVLSVDGRLELPGGFVSESGGNLRVKLQAVPYPVLLTGCLREPILTVTDPAVQVRRLWDKPFWPSLKIEGLRQTLNSKGSPDPKRWISLQPSLYQSFAVWNFEADISPLPSFPFEGRWEGTLTVPADGSYRLKLQNSFSGRAFIDMQGTTVFESANGLENQSQALKLDAGRAIPILVGSDEIQPDSEMRLVLEVPGGFQAVPSAWLRPAPLPLPEPVL